MESLNNTPILFYTAPDGTTQLDVKLENETVWLTRQQMAVLFDRDVKTIAKHVNNALSEELAGEVVVAKFATPTKHGAIKDKIQIQYVEYFNLEMITSVGFRVKSRQGVQFRKWANRVLKDYLVKGYAINDKIKIERYEELKEVVRLMARTLETQQLLPTDEAEGIFRMVQDYVYALDTLDRYDYEQLVIGDTSRDEKFHATYENAMEVIRGLHEKFGGSNLFGHEKDGSFHSSIGQIYQTFGGEELYPSIEEKAAMLLYLVVKNHSFSDGNKRIAATLFLWFLERNGILYRPDGSKRIGDNTLVALTLMIAESRTEEKDTMVKVVVNLINKRNL